MNICTLTESAKAHINAVCEENDCYAVSLDIKGGGCAGFEYDWGTIKSIDEVRPLDITMGEHTEYLINPTGKFVIGSESMMFMFGTEIDYVRTIISSNFEIRNPNAKSSCGCGVSVSFDLNEVSQNVT